MNHFRRALVTAHPELLRLSSAELERLVNRFGDVTYAITKRTDIKELGTIRDFLKAAGKQVTISNVPIVNQESWNQRGVLFKAFKTVAYKVEFNRYIVTHYPEHMRSLLKSKSWRDACVYHDGEVLYIRRGDPITKGRISFRLHTLGDLGRLMGDKPHETLLIAEFASFRKLCSS